MVIYASTTVNMSYASMDVNMFLDVRYTDAMAATTTRMLSTSLQPGEASPVAHR